MADKCTFQNSAGKTDGDFDNDMRLDQAVSSSGNLIIHHRTSRKRNASDTEEEIDGHLDEISSVENESRPNATQNVGSFSSSHSRIPNKTSKWTSDTIKILRISFDRDVIYPPLSIIKKYECEKPQVKSLLIWLKDIMIKRKYVTTFRVIEKKVQKLMDHFRFYKPLNRIDVCCIKEIKDHFDDIFQENRTTGETDLASKLPIFQPVDQFEQYWNYVANMFNSKAGDFSADLKYMISLHENGLDIPGSMYGTLFLDFIGMFGLHGVSFPSIPDRTLYIHGEEVKSTPDIVLMDRLNIDKKTHDAFSIKMLTVVKVKKKPQGHNYPTPAKMRKDGVPKTEREVTIDDKVIGQHCGDLVVFRSMSASDEGIMGMIVEGTQITFTYLLCNKEQLCAIKNSNYDYHGDRPSVLFSKTYNYLKASDRDDLMETLIILGVLQNSP